jgi:hypothetical protein
MKKYFAFVIFFSLSLLFSEEKLNYLKLDQYYGLTSFTGDDEIQLIKSSNDIFDIIDDINKDNTKLNQIIPYLDLVNNNSLSGIIIKDTIISNLTFRVTDEISSILEKYNKKRKDMEINKIYKVVSNNGNYSFSKFNISTKLKRTIFNKISLSIILSDMNWENMVLTDDKINKSRNGTTILNSINLHAGEDSYASNINFTEEQINSENYDLSSYFFANAIILKRFPIGGLKNIQEDDLFSINAGEMKLINTNIKVGNKNIDKIYEVITMSPMNFNFQVFVDRIRIYLCQNKLYSAEISVFISGNNALCDRINLIRTTGFLLDTLKFE